MDISKSRERGREDVSINTGNIEALALSGDNIGVYLAGFIYQV